MSRCRGQLVTDTGTANSGFYLRIGLGGLGMWRTDRKGMGQSIHNDCHEWLMIGSGRLATNDGWMDGWRVFVVIGRKTEGMG